MHGKTLNSIDFVAQFDSEVAAMMQNEFVRQQDGLELIASENFASPAVIAAMGSVLTNKYAEAPAISSLGRHFFAISRI